MPRKPLPTVGMEKMQSYNAQIEAGTLSIAQFATATAADRRSCIERGVWKHQSQVDTSFQFALLMAEIVDAGKDLQKGGINPDDVLGRWDVMPGALRAALKMGRDDYPGGKAKFVEDLRAFLTSQTPARQAPYLGDAARLLGAYGAMLRAADDYAAAEGSATP
jgi:hypothetical protein